MLLINKSEILLRKLLSESIRFFHRFRYPIFQRENFFLVLYFKIKMSWDMLSGLCLHIQFGWEGRGGGGCTDFI